MKKTSIRKGWRNWRIPLAAKASTLLATLLLTAGVGSALATDFCVSPGFEENVNPPANYTQGAYPWTYWGGTGGAIPNPVPTTDNSTPTVWSNFGNPAYVNVAAQNNMADVWLIPGATYHIHAQYYVPSSEVAAGVTPRAGIYFSMMSGTIRMLDPRYPDSPVNPVSPNITALDRWVTFDFDWVNTNSTIQQVNYARFMLWGGDGTNIGNGTTAPNPGGYFDNCQISSAAYTGTLSGLVKDSSGPLAGASVTLTYQGGAFRSTPSGPITTVSNGAYSFGSLIPGESYSITANKLGYTPVTVTVKASATVPDITLTPIPVGDPSLVLAVKPSDYSATDRKWNIADGQLAGDYFLAPGWSNPAKTLAPKAATGYSAIDCTANFSGFSGPLAPASITGASSRTFEAWVYRVANQGTIFDPSRQYTAADGQFSFTAWDGWAVRDLTTATVNDAGSAPYGLTVPQNAWVHLAVVYDGTTLTPYVNGVAGTPKTYAYNTEAGGAMTIGTSRAALETNTHGFNGFDGWMNFNGYMGAIRVYSVAKTAGAIATDYGLGVNFGEAATTEYKITASAGTGGTISPSGDVYVSPGASQTFTITAAYGYLISDVVVTENGTTSSKGAVSSYTFNSVSANGAITVSFTPLPTISGTVSGPAGPIYSAKVTLSTNADGSNPVDAKFSDASGQYLLAAPTANTTYYLVASKGGYVTSAVKTVAVATTSVTGQNFTLSKSAGLNPLVLLDASTLTAGSDLATWANAGSLGGAFNKYAGGVGPDVVTIAGKQAVNFVQPTQDDAGRRTLGGTIVTPAEVAGNSDCSISADLYRDDMSTPGGDNAFLSLTGWWAGNNKSDQFCYVNNKVVDHAYSGIGFTTVPSAGAWHNVTITYDGTTEKVYVDGNLDSSRTIALNIATGDQILIGSHSDVSGPTRQWNDQYWRYNGAIAKLQVFDQALSPDEVAQVNGLMQFSGKVTLEDGTTPVAGATVTAYSNLGVSLTATSAADGTYALFLSGGEYYSVNVTKDSYVQVSPGFADTVTAPVTLNFQMSLINAVKGIVKTAAGVPIPNAVVQVGQPGAPYMAGEPVPGVAAITDANGKYQVLGVNPNMLGTPVEIYADALGYAGVTNVVDISAAAGGVMTYDIVLTPKAETDYSYIQNGGFELGVLDGWSHNGSPIVGVTNSEHSLGSYAGYWESTEAAWYKGYLRQIIPVIPGSTYNIYFKLKTSAAVGQCGFDFLDANNNSLMWWGYDGKGDSWMYNTQPGVWEQALNYRNYNNSQKLMAVRVTPPDGCTAIQLIMGLGASAVGEILFVDDVVVDRVGPVAPGPQQWAGTTDSDWSKDANWISHAPVTNEVAEFSASASARNSVNLTADVSVPGLHFNSQAPNTTIGSTGGKSLTLSAGTVKVDAGTHTISAAVNGANGIAVSGPASATLNLNGTVGSAALAWATKPVSGPGVVLNGNASWTWAANSKYVAIGSATGGTLTINDNATFDCSQAWDLFVTWDGGDAGKIVQNGGTVITPAVGTAWHNNNGPGLQLGMSGDPITAEYQLNGGTLITPNVYNVNMVTVQETNNVLVAPAGSAIFRFNGGVLRGTQNDNLTDADVVAEGTTNLMGNLTHAYVGTGGAKIDTAGFNCGINQALEHDASVTGVDGGLTKLSAGTLTLYKASTYTGPTKVLAGTLSAADVNALGAGALEIDASATVDLAYTGTHNVSSLKIGGVSKPNGVYGAPGSGAANVDSHFTGTGTVTVAPAAPPTPTLPSGSFSLAGGTTPTFSNVPTVSGYTYWLVYKNNLTDAGNWIRIGTGTAGGGNKTFTDTTITPPNIPAHRFYRLEVQ